jgi:hypothetical protein
MVNNRPSTLDRPRSFRNDREVPIGAQFACIEVARVFNVTSAQTARRFDEGDLGQSATSPQEVRKLLLLINADQAPPTPTQVSKYGV